MLPAAGDLRELPRVPLRGEGSCGGGGSPPDGDRRVDHPALSGRVPGLPSTPKDEAGLTRKFVIRRFTPGPFPASSPTESSVPQDPTGLITPTATQTAALGPPSSSFRGEMLDTALLRLVHMPKSACGTYLGVFQN